MPNNKGELLMKVIRTYKLSDDTIIGIGLVGPEDENRLISGFRKLSDKSKMFRFNCGKADLTKKEREYLLNVDNVNHFAIGAVDLSKSYDVGIGLARYIKDKNDLTRAEVAITIIDEYQGNGIGTFLFKELINYAAKNNIKILTGYILKENVRMMKILSKYDCETREDCGNQYCIFIKVP